LYGLAFVSIVLLVILAVFSPPTIEIPAQVEDRIFAAKIKAREDTQQATLDRQKMLCRLRSLCSKFGDARQACATAGNYKMCINIKMGADAVDSYECTDDGAVSGQPNDMPTALDCFWTKLR
jgi:hypothetical protein